MTDDEYAAWEKWMEYHDAVRGEHCLASQWSSGQVTFSEPHAYPGAQTVTYDTEEAWGGPQHIVVAIPWTALDGPVVRRRHGAARKRR